MAARVLVVEDDNAIRASLALALEDEGYEVRAVARAEQALDVFGQDGADVVLVDLMLPGMDGFELTRQIRRHSGVPIVIVTARSDSHDIVAGLEAGADDYITKPFVVKELTARLRALRRRTQAGPEREPAIELGDLVIRREEGRVELAGEPVHLTKTEFRLLSELASRPGLIYSREQLLQEVWEYGYFGDTRIVDVHVRRLRTKIEADPSRPRHLITVRGFGYKLVR
ncbi:MAG TPA: response regulator transcription factor [Mycobacteriales bacterium]|nr:response regulator transcription factor [Mycobacteriales bacterium]